MVNLLYLSFLARFALGRVVWVPQEFDPRDGMVLAARASNSCGGDSSLLQCGGPLPGDFCCPQGTTCMALNVSSATAAVCCPAGHDCTNISPVSCDQQAQNATLDPSSWLHSEPTQILQKCGGSCCPMGYSCQQNEVCQAQSPPVPVSASSIIPAPSPTLAAVSSPSHSSSAAPKSPAAATSIAPAPTAADQSVPTETTAEKVHRDFSGAAFAAGFVPGIIFGGIAAACLIVYILRHRSRKLKSNDDEKQRDTLTDLSTLGRRPTIHGRSISEPTVNPAAGYRTEFLRGTSHAPEPCFGNQTYIRGGPATPAQSTPRTVTKLLFSRSPFLHQAPSTPVPTQPPMPAHLKRGTLSFTISPVRQLKKQKSMHSLRRQMTQATHSTSRRNNSRTRSGDLSRSGSMGTIRIMHTPDQGRGVQARSEDQVPLNHYDASESHSTWRTTDTSSLSAAEKEADGRIDATEDQYPMSTSTPPRQMSEMAEGRLGTPYSPSRYYGKGKGRVIGGGEYADHAGGLKPDDHDERRITTFSTLMERAGLRKSDLLMGSDVKH